METRENAAAVEILKERVDILQRKIAELQEMQKQSDVELAYYRELHKLYRKVLEAEELGPGHLPLVVPGEDPIVNGTVLKAEPSSVADAVRRAMAEHPGEQMHRLEVAKAVRERYPDIVGKTKDFEAAVGYALHAGKEKGLWAWVRSGVYKYK